MAKSGLVWPKPHQNSWPKLDPHGQDLPGPRLPGHVIPRAINRVVVTLSQESMCGHVPSNPLLSMAAQCTKNHAATFCAKTMCKKKHKAALVSDKGRRAPKMEDLAAHKILKEMAAPNVHCGCWKRWIQKRSKTKVQWKLQTLAMRFSCSSSFSCSVTCLFASLNALNSIVNDFVLNFYFLLWFFSCFVWHQTTKYLYKRPLFQETEHDWFSPRRNFDIRWLRQDPNTLTSDRVSSFCTEELLVCRIFWIVFSNATNKWKNGKRYNVAPQICIL